MRGFTLIEFIIYIAIVGGILVLISGVLWNVNFGNIKETAYQEVQQNARFALSKVTQETKKATAINSPVAGSSASSLSLEMENSGLNPTVVSIENDKLKITQGSNSYYLTSEQVKITNLLFTNLSYADTPGTIKVEMTIEHVNPLGRTEYEALVDVNSSITLLKGGAAGLSYLTQSAYRWRNDDGGE